MDAKSFDAVGVITTGRVGFADTFESLFHTQFRLGIPTVRTGSAYWEQALTHAVDRALAYNRKYLLFYDGDGIWEDRDAVDLYRIIDSDDTCDAVFPVQADRNGFKPLAHNWLNSPNQQLVEYNYHEPVMPYVHGHFGLTFIRSELFRNLPKPWFWSQPATDGSWDHKPGKQDADTYFWFERVYKHYHRGGTTGRRCLLANQTVIGHLELHVRWQCGPRVITQSLGEFRQNGKPYGLRNPRADEVPLAYGPDAIGQGPMAKPAPPAASPLPPEPVEVTA